MRRKSLLFPALILAFSPAAISAAELESVDDLADKAVSANRQIEALRSE